MVFIRGNFALADLGLGEEHNVNTSALIVTAINSKLRNHTLCSPPYALYKLPLI